jgi:hypothetical protein
MQVVLGTTELVIRQVEVHMVLRHFQPRIQIADLAGEVCDQLLRFVLVLAEVALVDFSRLQVVNRNGRRLQRGLVVDEGRLQVLNHFFVAGAARLQIHD